MPDDKPSGPRRYVPVPGVIDLDAVEDANFAEAFGEDGALDAAPDEPSGFPDAPDAPPPPPPPAPTPEPEPTPSGFPDTPDAPPPQEPPLPPGEGRGEGPTDAPAPLAEPAASPPTRAAADRPADAPPARPEPGRPPDPLPLAPPRDVVDSAKEATRSRGRELVGLVVQYGRAHVPERPAPAPRPDAGPPRMVGRIGQLIPVLQVVPWLLGAVFLLSFAWDFPGASAELFGREVALAGLLRVLSVSGLIGFGTNWLAITMLFQPREKRAIIPQGLIPAQRERVIYRLSEAISRELINADIIKQKIQESGVIGRYRDLALDVVRGTVEDPGFRADLKALAQDYAQEVLGSEPVRREVARLAVERVEQAGRGIGGVALGLYRTFAETDFQRRLDRALDELPGAVVPLLDRIDAALDAVPQKVEARADEIEEAATRAVLSFVEGFDVRAMIQDRARQFDEGQLEGLLKSTSNEQLNYIKYLGAVLGVFGGLVIWEPVGALAVFVAVGLALWGLDEALVRARRG